jgi:biofilm PGA synthesis N-glycosyltransferase PgaC
MTALVLIVFASSLVYLVMSAVIYYSLSNLKQESYESEDKLRFSILIAAKNEASNLSRLFKSIKSLNYKKELYEIIMIDDNSSDDTFDLAKKFESEIENFQVIKTQKYDTISGKKAALTTGINSAQYENIAITDADCELPSDWLNAANRKLTKFDIVFGVAPLKQSNAVINKIASFENLKAHMLVFAMANLNQPYSAAARNIFFKKKVMDNIGGYQSVNETLGGDDDLLIREAVKRKMKVGFITANESFVYSQTEATLSSYLKQKARHTSTSHHYLLKHKLLLGTWHLSNLLCLFSFLFSVISSIFVLPLIIKILVDYLITNSFQNKFGYKFSPLEIIILNIINEIFIVINFINSFRFKRRWN